jgi:NTE family protein
VNSNVLTTRALVLSGGAGYGAYQVGAMRALLQGLSPATGYTPLDPQILQGTSTGSFNVAVLLSSPQRDPAAAANYLENTWLNDIAGDSSLSGNGVMRFRANPAHFLKSAAGAFEAMTQLGLEAVFLAHDWMQRGFKFLNSSIDIEQRLLEIFDLGSFVSFEPLVNVVNSRIFPSRIQSSGRRIRILATNWRTGELRIFTEADMTPEIGHSVILASSALPGVLPTVEIRGEPYADGGIHIGTTLAPAIAAGADEIHVMYMDPEASALALPRVRSAVSSIYRTAIIQWAGAMQSEMRRVSDINRGIDLRERTMRESGSAEYPSRRQMKSTLSAVGREDCGEPQSGNRRITVHRYLPHDVSGEAFRWFSFGREHLARLIRMGFEDTVNHDCAKNKCVVPQAELRRSSRELHAQPQRVGSEIAA